MKVTSLLALGTLVLAAPTPAEQGVKIPLLGRKATLQTNKDGSVNGSWLLGHLRYTLLKYNKNFELPAFLQDVSNFLQARDTDAAEPLTDQSEMNLDELYYGSGTVGKQAFTFDFDTGSSDTFVPGPTCGSAQGCVGSNKYDNSGKSQGNKTSITYGSGQVTGNNYLDSVTIAGLTATNQNVISLTNATGFANSASDGLMGMAFPSIANSKTLPYFFNLINQGKVNPSEFSFYLGRAKSGTAANSEMYLGGRNEAKYTGAFTSVPVTSQTYWQVAIDGAAAGTSGLIAGTSGQAAIDTGTTLVIAPTAAAAALYAKIPGSFAVPFLGGSTQLYTYPCASSPNVKLQFAGKQFAINDLDFNFGTAGSSLGFFGFLFPNQCVGAVAGADLIPGKSLWIVGDTFLKSWYSTYKYVSPTSASVNFAKAV